MQFKNKNSRLGVCLDQVKPKFVQLKNSCLGLNYDYSSITKIVFARFDAIFRILCV